MPLRLYHALERIEMPLVTVGCTTRWSASRCRKCITVCITVPAAGPRAGAHRDAAGGGAGGHGDGGAGGGQRRARPPAAPAGRPPQGAKAHGPRAGGGEVRAQLRHGGYMCEVRTAGLRDYSGA
eukprot:1753582-Pyramimonas_sp.AAC.1